MITAVLITNGRSTCEYARKLLGKQAPVMVITDMNWVKANNLALKTVKTPYMLRVDDDMLLHPRALEFMMSNYRGTVAHVAKLYEHWDRKVSGKIKIYNIKKVKRIGGFRGNRQGKLDRTFQEDARKAKLELSAACKRSVVGLHACATYEECVKYDKLWGRSKRVTRHARTYGKTPEWQYEHAVKIIDRYNMKNNTRFWKWLQSK